jgi:hypothetical protein
MGITGVVSQAMVSEPADHMITIPFHGIWFLNEITLCQVSKFLCSSKGTLHRSSHCSRPKCSIVIVMDDMMTCGEELLCGSVASGEI